ncbi:MAG: hypothetical protein J0I12_08015 [Candidatus Eremiobacteraeota bacterium]|nr:hypothetical protein [Candidatus Eremiobacteraeota bacterium]
MRKPFTVLVSLLFPLAVQAKVPEQGAVFLLTRVEKNGDFKVKEGEILPPGTKLRFRTEARNQPVTVVISPFWRNNARAIESLTPAIHYPRVGDATCYTNYVVKDKPLRASDFYVVVTPYQSSTSDELTGWITQWLKKPLESQAARGALHDHLAVWLRDRDNSLNYSGPIPKELGGVRPVSAQLNHPISASDSQTRASTRPPKPAGAGAGSRDVLIGAGAEWLEYADWMPCTKEKPGVFVYHLGK